MDNLEQDTRITQTTIMASTGNTMDSMKIWDIIKLWDTIKQDNKGVRITKQTITEVMIIGVMITEVMITEVIIWTM